MTSSVSTRPEWRSSRSRHPLWSRLAGAAISGWKEGQEPAITRNRAEMGIVGGRASPGVRSIPFVTR
jgi:hypothetical protein